jgi:hypothetical protein
MIIIPGEFVQNEHEPLEQRPVEFCLRQDENLYSLLGADQCSPRVQGTVVFSEDIESLNVSAIGQTADRIRILVHQPTSHAEIGTAEDHRSDVRGYVLTQEGWSRDEVLIVPV